MSDSPALDRVREALIVAGGRGTRLQPLTHAVPKPLLPFCGAPFLEGVLRRVADAGIQRVHLIVGAETAPFETLRRSARGDGLELAIVPEPEPLDTAGGVRAVADDFDGPVLVLNGDILTDVDYAAVARRHVASGADATLVLTTVQDTSSYGVVVRDGARVGRFVEKPEPGTLPGHATVNAGTYVLEPRVLTRHPPGRLSFERDVFPALLGRGDHVEGYMWEGVWQDLGTPDRYREGHRLALLGALAWPSLADVPTGWDDGVRVASDARVDAGAVVRPPVLILPGASVAAGARVGPFTVVGADAEVGPDAVLASAVLHDKVTIGPGVVGEGLLAGAGAHVAAEPGAGRGVVLGQGASVSGGEQLADGERRPEPRG
jgi:NDP-sugar pyrophosphorylase family protein